MAPKFSVAFISTLLLGLLIIVDDNLCQANRESTASIMNRRFYGRPPLFSGRYAGQVVDILGDDDDLTEINKRQLSDDYGHMRFGKRDQFDDYGHMRFGRSHD